MSIDPSDPRWARVLTSDADIGRASLATRILVTRLRGEVKKAPHTLSAQVQELQGFVAKNGFAQGDVAFF